MAFSKDEIRDIYRKRAERYDFTAQLYYLLGFREQSYRKKAVNALRLDPGDTVVEIGCGTGLNFGLLQSEVGPEGRIVGVDLTPEMLDGARERAEKQGWKNVELVESDAARFEFPSGANGVISTFALTLVPEYDEVIRSGAEALTVGGRWVVADLKLADGWAAMLLPLLLPLFRPFGVTEDLGERRPWESLRNHLDHIEMSEHYFGYTYVAYGEKRTA